MSNTAIIAQKQNDLTLNDYLQIMIIDNGDGTRSLRFIDQQTPNLPGAAAQIVASGDTLRAAGLTALAIGTAVSGGSANAVLFEDAGQLLAVDTGNFEYNNISFTLTVSAINLLVGITFPDNVRQTFNPGATVPGLNVGSVAADPTTPINGDLWYDSALNLLRARIGGVSTSLGALAIGNSISGATAGSVLFAGAAGVLAQDNANLFWDDTNNLLLLSTGIAFGAVPATTGTIRLANLQTVTSRNAANSANITILLLNATDNVDIAPATSLEIASANNGWRIGAGAVTPIGGVDGPFLRKSTPPQFTVSNDTNTGFDMPGSDVIIVLANAIEQSRWVDGGFLSKRQVTALATTPQTLTATQSRRCQTNEGAAAQIVMNLPAAAAGLEYVFIVQDTDGIQVTAAAGDTIRIAASVSSAGGTATSTTIGSALILTAINATEWMAISSVGTWALA